MACDFAKDFFLHMWPASRLRPKLIDIFIALSWSWNTYQASLVLCEAKLEMLSFT